MAQAGKSFYINDILPVNCTTNIANATTILSFTSIGAIWKTFENNKDVRKIGQNFMLLISRSNFMNRFRDDYPWFLMSCEAHYQSEYIGKTASFFVLPGGLEYSSNALKNSVAKVATSSKT